MDNNNMNKNKNKNKYKKLIKLKKIRTRKPLKSTGKS